MSAVALLQEGRAGSDEEIRGGRVDADLGLLRVARIVSAVDAGRILNEKLARSQIIDGAVMGIGMTTALRTAYRSSWPPTASASQRPGRPGTRLVQTVGRVAWGRPATGKPGVALAPQRGFRPSLTGQQARRSEIVRCVVLHTQEIRGQRSTATARQAGIAGRTSAFRRASAVVAHRRAGSRRARARPRHGARRCGAAIP
jgi:hypothetical protein